MHQQIRPDKEKTKAELLTELETTRSELAQLHQAFQLVIANDITQRQQAQNQLQVTQARLEHLLSASPAVIYSCQTVGDYAATFVSDNVAEILGYDSREFLQNPNFWASGIHPDDVERVFTDLVHLFEIGSHTHEYRFRHQNGTYCWVKDECKLVRDVAGQPLEIVGYWADISERKLAEQARQESEANFQKLMNLSPVAIGITNLDGTVEYLNEQFTQLLGYTLADCADMDLWWQMAYPDSSYRERVIQTWREAIATAHATGCNIIPQEYQVTCKDGSIRQIEFSHALIGDKGITICHDITQRQQQQALVTAQNQVLEAIATGKTLPEVLTILARAMEEQSPKAMCSILLTSPDGTVLGNGVAPSLPDSYNAAINSNGVAIAPISGSCGTAAFRREAVVVADIATDPLWTVFRDVALAHGLRACWSHPILSNAGKVLGTFAMYYPTPHHPSDRERDLVEKSTYLARVAIERDWAEQALRQSERRYANLTQAAPVGIFRTNCQGHCVYVNDRWCEIAGLTRNAALGTGWILSIHPQDRERLFAEWYRAAQQQTMFCSEYRFERPDGTITWVFGQAVPEKDNCGEILGYIGTITDISDRVLAETELNLLNVQLEQRILERTAQLQTVNHALSYEIAQRQQTEAALRESEQRYQAIFNQTFQFIGLLSLDGILLEANQTALDFGGFAHADVIGIPVWETPWWQTDTESQHRLQEAVKAAAAGEFVRYEVELIGAGGATATVDFSLKPVWDENGKVVLIIPEGRDISDRKHTEAALKESEAKFRQLAETIEEVFWISDPRIPQLIYVSPAYETIWGRSCATLYANFGEWIEAIHPADRQRVQTSFFERVAQGLYEEEYRIIHPDGTIRWIRDRGFPIHDELGELQRVAGIAEDITDRKLAEAGRRESEVRMKALLDNAQSIVYMKDHEGRYLLINRRYEELFHIKAETHLGKTDYDIFPSAIAAEFQANDRAVLLNNAPLEMEEVAWQDGEPHTYISTKFPVYDDSGVAFAVCGISTDITERKQTEEALRESEARFRQLAENLDDVVWIADANHQVIYVSPAYAKIWGQSCEELYRDSSQWLQAVHSEDRPQVEQALQATTLHGGYDAEYRIICPDGTIRWIRDRGFLIQNEAGEVCRIAGIAEDISDRKVAEAILYQRQQEFVALVENSPDVVARFDRQLRHSYINSAIEKELGIPPQAFIGKTLYEMGFPDDEFVNIFEPALQKVLATGQEQIIELSAQTPNGRTFSQTRLIPETAPDGTVNSILSLGRDITAIRAAEIAQRQQMEREQLLNAIVQQMRESLNLEEILNTTVTQVQTFLQADRVLVYQLEPNGSGKVVAQAVAPGWKSLLALALSIEAFPLHTQQQYLRGKIGTICDRDTGNIPPCLVEFMHQTQARAKLTIPIIQHSQLWGLLIVHQCSQPRKWQAWESKLMQQLANKMAIAIHQSELHQQLQTELQERRQVEQALRQSETEFRLLSESSPLGIFRTNDRGEYTYINPRYQIICDCTFAEAMGRGWLQLIHPDNRDFVISQNSKAVCERKPCLSEFHFVRKDGSSRYCRVQATPLFNNDNGTYMGHVGTLEDITESRAIAQMKNDFIGIVSHELRTPLTSLRGSLGLLATGVYDNKPEKGKRMLQVAAESAARLVRLVSDILDLERLESGKVALEQQHCNAADLMLQSVEAMRASAEQSQVTLSLTPLQQQIWAAPDAIIQTLTNLLSNAVKFSPPGSTVWLSAAVVETLGAHSSPLPQPPPYVLFQVKDRGRGIPADKLETVFGQFQQVDVSDSRQKGGTGLGLAICRSIIRQHGGQIWAESIFGEGSTFYFTLPLDTVTSDQLSVDG